MKNLRKTIFVAALAALAAVTMTLSSCSSDDPAPITFGDPTITATPGTITPGQPVEITIAVAADAGLASVALDGTSIKTYSTDTKTDIFVYEYDGTSSTLTFTVTDKQSTPKTADTEVNLVPQVVIDAAISANTSWTKDKRYLLKGNIYVESGAELTIEAGTVIFGDKTTKGALIISRGGKINATGTETLPIVFTSSAPKTFRNYGDWGGVVILGKAKNNQNADQLIEGISAATGDNGKYGGDGSHEDDNSGVLKYVRIEFAGIALTTDNEINGLTFGSVGSGTTIDHIQVSYSGDDSFEWFGGTANATYLIAHRGWDDDFDTDFGFTGHVQYAVSFRDPNNADKSGSNGFESDNDAAGSTNLPKTAPKFANITWFGPHVYSKLSSGALNKSAVSANYQFGGHLRRNSEIQIYNSVFVGSQLEGAHFDKTGAEAVVKGNYYGRIGVNTATPGTVKKVTTGNNYVDTNFDADNFLEANALTVDLSAKFAGMTGAMNIEAPTALLAGGSSLLTGAATVPAGLTQKDYIGAFDATTNWLTGTWVNLTPNNTEY